MAKRVLVFLCAFLVISTANLIKPRDLADEAQEQINELESLVQGEIQVAHGNFDDLDTYFKVNADNAYKNGGLALQLQHEDITGQLATIKFLASAAGKDISSCTNFREDALDKLPVDYTTQMAECIHDLNDESTKILTDARYIVDISINKVHELSYQLRQCRGDILCISPLISQIELNKIRLPQNIKTEVQAADSLVTVLELSVQICSDVKVSEYVAEAYNILGDIVDCVNKIINSVI